MERLDKIIIRDFKEWHFKAAKEKLLIFFNRPGINKAGICKEAGISQQYVNRVLNDPEALPTVKMLEALWPVVCTYGFTFSFSKDLEVSANEIPATRDQALALMRKAQDYQITTMIIDDGKVRPMYFSDFHFPGGDLKKDLDFFIDQINNKTDYELLIFHTPTEKTKYVLVDPEGSKY